MVFCVAPFNNGDGPFLAVMSDGNVETSRHISHVRHLEPIYQLVLEFIDRQLVST